MTPLLEVRDATARFGGVTVLTGVSLEATAGAAVGLVGPNGAGKSTLLDAISGFVGLEQGTVRVAGQDVTRLSPHRRARLGLGRTFQTLDLFEDLTVAENVQVATHAPAGARAAAAADLPTPPLAELAELGDRLPSTLAHAQRKAVGLARALAGAPRVLLLDEPAAGLDAGGRDALASRIRELTAAGLAVVVADHDFDLVLSVCERVTVLDLGRVIAAGSPAEVRADPAVAAAYLGERTGTAIERQPADVTGARPTGGVLLEARQMSTGYGPVEVVHELDLEVRAGEVVALLGPNGAGKTTALSALSGILPVTGGAVTALGLPVDRRPHRLAAAGLAHVPQGRGVLGSLSVLDNLRLAARGKRRARVPAVDAALERFPSLVPLRDRRAGLLSGGEQQILALARAVAARPRLLLLDELSLGLAPRAVAQALGAVRDLAEEGAGVLVVEQHPALALAMADRATVLARGRAVFEGAAADLAARPEVLEEAYLGTAALDQ